MQSRRDFSGEPSQYIDTIVIDFMKTFECPNLVVKEVRFKDQLPVRDVIALFINIFSRIV